MECRDKHLAYNGNKQLCQEKDSSMLNTNKLRALMIANGYNISSTARKLGISPNTLGKKLSGKSQFNLDEVDKLIRIFHIQDPASIFFASEEDMDEDDRL